MSYIHEWCETAAHILRRAHHAGKDRVNRYHDTISPIRKFHTANGIVEVEGPGPRELHRFLRISGGLCGFIGTMAAVDLAITYPLMALGVSPKAASITGAVGGIIASLPYGTVSGMAAADKIIDGAVYARGVLGEVTSSRPTGRSGSAHSALSL